MESYATILVMAVFYAAYFTKAVLQRRQGVRTMILGKGNKPVKERRIELLLKITTFTIPFVELASIYLGSVAVTGTDSAISQDRTFASTVMEGLSIGWIIPASVRWAGVVVAAGGVACFIAGMATMRDSWRAGIPSQKETELVTGGIYRLSRNPAFLGFDLLYIGILIAYPNIWHAVAVVIALCLFHKQIKSEEAFLENSFGQEYVDYKKKVHRYI